MAKFAIGEMVYVVPYDAPEVNNVATGKLFGLNGTVLEIRVHRRYISGTGYVVQFDCGVAYDYGEVCLRKIRPQMDWLALIKNLPIEELV